MPALLWGPKAGPHPSSRLGCPVGREAPEPGGTAPGEPGAPTQGPAQAHLVPGRQLHQLSQGHIRARHPQQNAVGPLEGNTPGSGGDLASPNPGPD